MVLVVSQNASLIQKYAFNADDKLRLLYNFTRKTSKDFSQSHTFGAEHKLRIFFYLCKMTMTTVTFVCTPNICLFSSTMEKRKPKIKKK